MQTLYLIRHTTPEIAPNTCYGQLDIDVAASFEHEAQRVRHWLPPLELIVASPLLRTRRLAEYLAREMQCELRGEPRLMEKHFGAWEGKFWDDIAREEVDAWASDVIGYAPAGGESGQQVLQRTADLLHDVAQLPQRHIALVAHAGSIRAMLSHVGNLPLTDLLDWEVDYGAVIGVRNTQR